MKTNEPQADTNTLLAAGANVSPRNEAHGLEGFGSGSNVRPASWCAGLTHTICSRVALKLWSLKLITPQV
jgi:hypothetical protein